MMRPDTDPGESPRTLRSDISAAVVAAFVRHTGRGPATAQTIIDGNVVLVLLTGVLSSTERTLIAQGDTTVVDRVRARLYIALRDELVERVQVLCGVTVVSAMADTDLETDTACEIFVLTEPPGIREV